PRPLGFAQHCGPRIMIRSILAPKTLARFTRLKSRFQRTAKIAAVEQNQLNPRSLRTPDAAEIDAFAAAPHVVVRNFEKVEEHLLRFTFLRILGAAVVDPVVVVVPRSHDRANRS